jgi:hypothetical protein
MDRIKSGGLSEAAKGCTGCCARIALSFPQAEDFAPKNPPFAPYGENSPDFMI